MVAFKGKAQAFTVLCEIDCASACGSGDGLILAVELGDKILAFVGPRRRPGTAKNFFRSAGCIRRSTAHWKQYFQSQIGNSTGTPEFLGATGSPTTMISCRQHALSSGADVAIARK